MSKWVLARPGTWDYPTLGFTATNGDILDATNAPDAFWSLNGDQGAAETVTRYGSGSFPAPAGSEVTDGSMLVYDTDSNAYLPESATLPTWMSDAVTSMLENQPGAELGYVERETDYATTNTSISSTTAGVIDAGFSVGPIVGTGRAVDIEFYAPQARHSVANAFVLAYLLVNGAAQTASGQNAVVSSPQTTVGRELTLKRRLVLADGVSYTFTIGICGGGAGTCTIDGASGTAFSLSVIGR